MAELAALLCGCGRVEKMSDGNRKLWIQTENEAVARKSFTLLRKTFNIETAIVIREGSHLKRGKVYLVEVTDPARTEEVLQGTKLSVDNETGLLEMDNSLVVQMNCCKRAFIRPVRSVIQRKGIILRSCVRTAGKQNNYRGLSAVFT